MAKMTKTVSMTLWGIIMVTPSNAGLYL
jgi:hypothetical protein